MDIVTTGISNNQDKINKIVRYIREMIKKYEEKFLEGIIYKELRDKLIQDHERDLGEVNRLEILDAVNKLQDEGEVQILGNKNSEKYSLKKTL